VMNLALLLQGSRSDLANFIVEAWAELDIEQRRVQWIGGYDSPSAAVSQLLHKLDGPTELIDVVVPDWLPGLCSLSGRLGRIDGERVIWTTVSTPLGTSCLARMMNDRRSVGMNGISNCPLWIEPGYALGPEGNRRIVESLRSMFEGAQGDDDLYREIAESHHQILAIEEGIQRLEQITEGY
jgi:hypothetical protein